MVDYHHWYACADEGVHHPRDDPMLIGYVSDERYLALSGVALEFVDDRGRSWEARSRATGAVHADLPAGDYTVTLQHPGFGAKHSKVSLPDAVAAPVPAARRRPERLRLAQVGPRRRGRRVPGPRRRTVPPGTLAIRLVARIRPRLGWFDEHGPRATMQVTPDGDYTRSGVEWNKVGYNSPTHHQFVTAPEQSGLYYFRARTPSGLRFSFPWIVAPPRPTAPLAVLASNITWNAYNSFGGRSNYIHADELPPTPTVNSRYDLERYREAEFLTWSAPSYAPLSFDRPEPFNHIDFDERLTDPIEGRQACHLAPAEWRLLGWLEHRGLAYDFYAETQLDEGTLDLSAYRALVLSVHPEYWTRRMYDRVKQWVFHDGGRLLYLGGNGLNGEVEIEGPAMRVHNGRITGLDVAGIGAESRFALRHESEANLLGVVFTPPGAMTGRPYRVVSADHWIFHGTGLQEGDIFG